MTKNNPAQSPVTRAYFDAQKALGGKPETPREAALFEALQASLQKLYDSAALHADCIQRIRDVQDELEKTDELRLRKAPDPVVDLVAANRLIENRRHAEPLTPPGGTGYRNDEYRQFVNQRDVTDMLVDLVEEIESWRALVKENL